MKNQNITAFKINNSTIQICLWKLNKWKIFHVQNIKSFIKQIRLLFKKLVFFNNVYKIELTSNNSYKSNKYDIFPINEI